MRDLGIGFASVVEAEFDFSSPSSRLILNFLVSFAEFGSAMTTQHVRRVNDLKSERAVHRGAIPFGYKRDPASTRADSRLPDP